MINYQRRPKARLVQVGAIVDFVIENKGEIEQKILWAMAMVTPVMAISIGVQGIPMTCRIIFKEIIPVFLEVWKVANVHS